MGATVTPEAVVFRVWAPDAKVVHLRLGSDEAEHEMRRHEDGTWSARLQGCAGLRYSFRLDGGQPYPDPYSRFQPEGVHGPSQIVDPNAFAWRLMPPSVDPGQMVIYECHIGTFTPEGTFEAASDRLSYLTEIGVNAIEVMPVAEFAGTRNWGYDGVDWFAPSRNYGGPEAFRRFVEAAHERKLAVILDVVYNHFGPAGNYLRAFSQQYFTDRYQTPWGDAINYEDCPWARRLAVDNALCWLREFHVDGLRVDATFAIHDSSSRHLLGEISEAVRAEYPTAVLIAETHENDARYFKRAGLGGYGFDACWADDFHHVIRRLLAGDQEGYFRDYSGTAEELARTINHGFLYEGQPSTVTGRPRGTPARDAAPRRFIYCIQNHDQVGNRAFGDRLSSDVGQDAYRAASMLLLLLPYTPMLFMGQEFAASSPFQYFTDHEPELGRLVTEGRRKEFGQFAAFADPATRATIPDPQEETTFRRSKLDWAESENTPGREVRKLYQDALSIRRSQGLADLPRGSYQAASPVPGMLTVQLKTNGLLLAANFSGRLTRLTWADLRLGANWQVLIDSNDGRYGGSGKKVSELDAGGLAVDSFSAVLLAAR